MFSALHKSAEFSTEESCPLVTGAEEDDAVLKILDKQKHHAWVFYGFQLDTSGLNIWKFTTCVLVILVIYLVATVRYVPSQYQYTYANGFDTEFCEYCNFYDIHISGSDIFIQKECFLIVLLAFLAFAREAIGIKKIKFTGGLYYDYDGVLHVSSNPKEPTYVGPPSEEIDDAWKALIHGS
jgi:hypothetical protein